MVDFKIVGPEDRQIATSGDVAFGLRVANSLEFLGRVHFVALIHLSQLAWLTQSPDINMEQLSRAS